MANIELEDEIIDLLFEGIIEPGAIQKTIKLCCEKLQASGGNIQVTSKTDFKPLYFVGVGDGYNETTINKYLDHWQYANAHRDAMRRAYIKAPGKPFLCHEHISESDFETGAYFQEFFKSIGQRWLAGGLVRDARGTEVSIAFSRRLGDPCFGPEEAAFIATLMPHVRRATSVALKLDLSIGETPTLLGNGLAATKVATFLVDSRKKIHWCNDSATTLLNEDIGIYDGEEGFGLDDQTANEELDQAIASVLNQRLAATPSAVVKTNGRKQSFELEILPATMPRDSLINSVSLALIMVQRTGLSPAITETLRENYGLTKAESALAVLMAEGISIEKAALRKKVSPHTVRTQLRSIFLKTGVTQQTALTALVWRST